MSKLIRLDRQVPVNYVVESRDMQTLLRLLSMAANNIKLNATNIEYVNNPLIINNRLLNLLSTKLGFFTRKQFTDDELRYTLDVFSYLVRNKGSRKSISEAIKLFFYINNVKGKYIIDVNEQNYSVNIYLNVKVRDISLLTEIFRYILPTGYFLNIYFYNEQSGYSGFGIDTRYKIYDLVQSKHEKVDTRNAAYIYPYPEPVEVKIGFLKWKATTRIKVNDYIKQADIINVNITNKLSINNVKVDSDGYINIEISENQLLPNKITIQYSSKFSNDDTSLVEDDAVIAVNMQKDIYDCFWTWVGEIQTIQKSEQDMTSFDLQTNLLVDKINSLVYKDDLLIKTTDGSIVRDYQTSDGKLIIYASKPTSVMLTRRNTVRSVDTTPIHNIE